MTIYPALVLDALKQVRYPATGKNLVESGMVADNIRIDGNKVEFSLLLKPRDPFAASLVKAAEQAILTYLGEDVRIKGNVKVEYLPENTGEQEKPLSKVKCRLAIASGKGGVGKSTVSANLAVALAKQGYKVGLLDADIFGPSIPKMFGVEDARPVADDEGRIVPIEKYGIKLLSIGFFVNTGSAVVWRGAMASNAIKQLIAEAAWGDLDFFLIDLPPGTSDIHLTIVQTIQLDGAIVVCTPQQVAIADAVKAIDMFENDKINVPVIGLIENMAWFSTPDMPGKKYYIFGRGGVEKLAEERGMALLGRIPIEENVCESSDAGTPLCLGSGGDVVQAFDNVAKSNIFAQISHK